MNKVIKLIIRIIGLFIGIFSVVLYRQIPEPHNVWLWFTITLGYDMFFNESLYDLFDKNKKVSK